MMCSYVGISVLAGVSIVACLMIFNYFISKKINRLNEEVLGAKDERMKVTQEMLDAIRFIKISAIEKLFFNKLEDKRGSEIAFYLKKGFAVIFMVFMYWITAPLLLSATFITYTALGN
jgi:ABC-type bacteriocin/lantibiotic exporter with double-glycine peptidase domain